MARAFLTYSEDNNKSSLYTPYSDDDIATIFSEDTKTYSENFLTYSEEVLAIIAFCCSDKYRTTCNLQ